MESLQTLLMFAMTIIPSFIYIIVIF